MSKVEFIRPVFVDILGRMLDFTLPISKLDDISNGIGIDGSSIEGFARTTESDLLFIPDISKTIKLPFEYNYGDKSWYETIIFGKIVDSNGEIYPGDSRSFLQSVIEKNKDIGLLNCGAELEFFIFNDINKPSHTGSGGYFRSGNFGELRKYIQFVLQEMGIDVETDHHEVSNSQHEIDLKHTNILDMADNIILAKYVIKRIVKNAGYYASFMPKPINGINGNGMHIHVSAWKDDVNLFCDDNDIISSFAKKFINGLIKHGKEIQLLLNQWINSYKRLIPGYESPTVFSCGDKDRSTYIRIPSSNSDSSTRIEIRNPDPGANPYLVMAAINLAGFDGVANNIPDQKPYNFATSLGEAINVFKDSEFIKQNFPEHMFNKLIENKMIECDEFNKHVTDYEISKYYSQL